jgi:ubiquinone/menaquinone biosynthesis C-methylase UbiE
MAETNVWSDISNLSPSQGAEIFNFLEDRSNRQDQREVNQFLCQVLDPQPGEKWLEAGCGSGVLCRMMASSRAHPCSVTGLDSAFEMLKSAQTVAMRASLDCRPVFINARVQQIPYPESCFDHALAARLLLHVPLPDHVLSEILRVIRPGGRLVLMDWDLGTLMVDHSQRELSRRILDWRCDHHGGDNWSGRQLRRLALEAGLQQVKVVPYVSQVYEDETSLARTLWRAAELCLENGVIDQPEYSTWVEELKERLAQKHFFASIIYFIVQGCKPSP